MATGTDAIRQALNDLVASGKSLTLGKQQPTLRVGDLALTSTRLNDGGVTTETARRQPDGTWRWVVDRWNVVGEQPRFLAAHWLPEWSALSAPVWEISSWTWFSYLASMAEILGALAIGFAGLAVIQRHGLASLAQRHPPLPSTGTP